VSDQEAAKRIACNAYLFTEEDGDGGWVTTYGHYDRREILQVREQFFGRSPEESRGKALAVYAD
jgi:hypothetical protein